METTSPFPFPTRLVVFAWLWALAVVLHLLYLSNSYAAFSSFTADHTVHLALAVAAVALLIRPRSITLLTVVCVLTPVTAWFEAPRLANHWLLASLIALVLLSAMAVGSSRRDRSVPRSLIEDGLPTARIIFLVVYGFCALAKFNSSFIDPTVSCANHFTDEVAHSLGLTGFSSVGSDWWMHIVPWVVMTIETSVVVLLLIVRTRVLGVILALVFHGVIAFDTAHAFSDFSSVIAALVVLFLPDSFFASIEPRLRTPTVRVAVLAVAGVASALLIWQSTDTGYHSIDAIGDVRDVMWWVVWAIVTTGVVVWSVRTRTIAADIGLLPEDRWLLAWPALALLIGSGPYLEVRTATSWNMYANLQTARGSSNSFVIPATAELGDAHRDLVRIVSSGDAGLQQYVGTDFEVPFVNLRSYTSTHPDTSVTFIRGGETITVEHTRADPDLGRNLPWWQEKIVVHRSIDTSGAVSCQDTTWAAR